MILSLPLSLPDATPIGDQHAMQTRAGITYYLQPPTLRLPPARAARKVSHLPVRN